MIYLDALIDVSLIVIVRKKILLLKIDNLSKQDVRWNWREYKFDWKEKREKKDWNMANIGAIKKKEINVIK